MAVEDQQEKINIGCEALILRNGKALLGKRGKAAFGSGTWGMPGGHLKYRETARHCINREITEETGILLNPNDHKLVIITDDIQESGFHYIHLTFLVDINSKDPRIMEPESCEAWEWFDLSDLPSNLFPPHKKIFANLFARKNN